MNHIVTSNSLNHIQQFRREVQGLATEYPISLLGTISRKWLSFTITPIENAAYQHRISMLFSKANRTAELILKRLPENIRDLNSLRQKFAQDSEFKTSLEKKIGFSLEELISFCDDMDFLFKQVYPFIGYYYSKETKMSKWIQNHLCPELKQLRLEKKHQKSLLNNLEHKTQRKIAKGKLAANLGRGIETNKGSTGTLIIHDINRKPVGVHKVSEKDVPWLTRIKNLIKSIFGGQLTYLSKKYLAQPRSERAAFLLSSFLGFNLAPCSLETTIQDKRGVFQIFIKNEKNEKLIFNSQNIVKYPQGKGPLDYIEAKYVIDSWDHKNTFTESEKTKFQCFAIFDYLIGNLDRHEENWFVAISQMQEITHIKAIDNAYAFPKRLPKKGALGTRNQYKWQARHIANYPFTGEAIQFVRDRLKPEKILECIQLLKHDLPDFLDKDMEELLISRAKVAYLLVQKFSQTPASLAFYSSEEEIKMFLTRFPYY